MKTSEDISKREYYVLLLLNAWWRCVSLLDHRRLSRL